MPQRELVIRGDVPPALVAGLKRLADQLDLPGDFAADVTAEASSVAANRPPDTAPRTVLTQPFVTIDPAGSMDLDQALFIETAGPGYRVWYAISDVAAWVRPGGAIDAAARLRGETYYAPQTRLPLHPTSLSEGVASLLPDGVARPANVWRIDLDATGAVTDFTVVRAAVTSVAKLDYVGVQHDLDAGTAPAPLQLLRTVGELRTQQEAARGGISLNLPNQEVVVAGDGWTTTFANTLPVENWNAQISLLTGYCAAALMRQHGVGILRTLPPADEQTIRLLRSVAASLRLPWPDGVGYADFVRGLDPSQPAGQAMMNSCTLLFRGAGYTVIGSPADTGHMPHAALASEYAHTTAPLRRLVDRFTGAICGCLAAGEPVPAWVSEALPTLPDTMEQADRRAKAFERGVIGLTEALALRHRIGQQFEGVIVEIDERDATRGTASLPDQAVEAAVRAAHPLTLGAQVELRLIEANIGTGDVLFEQVT